MQEKKNILTYEGLRKYEEELHDLKSRETCPRMQSTMQQKMSRETSKPVSKNWRRS